MKKGQLFEQSNPFDNKSTQERIKLIRQCGAIAESRLDGKVIYRAAFIGVCGECYPAAEIISLKLKYGFRCIKCGQSEVSLSERLAMDHVAPVSIGGSNSIDNFQPMCRACNSAKNAKHLDYRECPNYLCVADSGVHSNGIAPRLTMRHLFCVDDKYGAVCQDYDIGPIGENYGKHGLPLTIAERIVLAEMKRLIPLCKWRVLTVGDICNFYCKYQMGAEEQYG